MPTTGHNRNAWASVVNIVNTINIENMIYTPKPKDGRSRSRRSFVFYDDTIRKMKVIADENNVQVSELVEGALSQIVDAWEKDHGAVSTLQTIRLIDAVDTARKAEPLKRGNPHPSGRKKKLSKV